MFQEHNITLDMLYMAIKYSLTTMSKTSLFYLYIFTADFSTSSIRVSANF